MNAFCWLTAAAGALTAAGANAQVSFSVDYESSSVSIFDCGLTPITEADILRPALAVPAYGPLATPCISISGGPGGLGLFGHPACVGHAPGTTCRIEVDALSYGVDAPTFESGTQQQVRFHFSVDEHAVGGGPGSPVPPNVWSEGAAGALEAAADVFADLGLPFLPMPPGAPFPGGNTAILDGNGIISPSLFNYRGLGLHERNVPALTIHEGDNLDAYDLGGPGPSGATYFSLDASFVDPLTGLLLGSSALAHGFVGGDVLVKTPAGLAPVLYAPAFALGLDLIDGPDSDDLDALILFENGVPGYQPSMQPFDWLGGPSRDMLLFSVRRGSAVIGAPDSIFGIPIEPGDILTTPLPTALGGVSPFPGIFVAAEKLGLQTARTFGVEFGDDVDALDHTQAEAVDCNGNGVEDALEIALGGAPDCNRNGSPDTCDIASGLSTDLNGNLVPDECDWGLPAPYCVAKVTSLGVTCVPMIDSEGTPSVANVKPFLIKGENIRNFVNGILFYGYGPAAIPFQGGTLCIAPPLRRMPLMNSGGSLPFGNCSGSYTLDFGAHIGGGTDPFLLPGTSVHGQWWFRDTPASFGTGLSNALRFIVCP